MVIDSGVDVDVADALLDAFTGAVSDVAEGPAAAAVGDTPELLRVDVDELSRCCSFIPDDLTGWQTSA